MVPSHFASIQKTGITIELCQVYQSENLTHNTHFAGLLAECVECCRVHFRNVIFNLSKDHDSFPGRILIMTFKLVLHFFVKIQKVAAKYVFANVLCYFMFTSLLY